MKKAGGIFHPQKFGNVFACSTTTRGAMGKRRPQRDSPHQMGPEIPLHRILIVVVLLIMVYLDLDALPYSDAVPHHDAVLYHDTVQYHNALLYHHIVPYCINSTRMYQDGTHSRSI